MREKKNPKLAFIFSFNRLKSNYTQIIIFMQHYQTWIKLCVKCLPLFWWPTVTVTWNWCPLSELSAKLFHQLSKYLGREIQPYSVNYDILDKKKVLRYVHTFDLQAALNYFCPGPTYSHASSVWFRCSEFRSDVWRPLIYTTN